MNLRQGLGYRAARHLGRQRALLEFPRAVVSFCFDDFPHSAADAGAAILAERGLRGTFYPCAGYAGRTVEGVRQYDVDDLLRVAADGHEIGSHTTSHPRLSRLSSAQIAEEIARASCDLAAMGLTAPAETLAYPFGDVSLRAKRVAGKHFLACRGVWAGLNAGVIDRGLLRCVCLESHVLLQKPVEAWIEEAAARRAWLIFLTHDVTARPTRHGVTPAALAAVVDRAIAAGADVLPVAAAFRRGTQAAARTEAAADTVPAPGAGTLAPPCRSAMVGPEGLEPPTKAL